MTIEIVMSGIVIFLLLYQLQKNIEKELKRIHDEKQRGTDTYY